MAELNNFIAYAAFTTAKSKPEELARLQAGGERSVTPATRHPDKSPENGRQNPLTRCIPPIFRHFLGLRLSLLLLLFSVPISVVEEFPFSTFPPPLRSVR